MFRASDAPGRLGKTGPFAGPLARPGGEQLVNVLQFETRDLGKNAHHRGDAVFLIVIPQDRNEFLVFLVQLLDAFLVLHPLDPLRAPVGIRIDEAVFIHREGFPHPFDCRHVSVLL